MLSLEELFSGCGHAVSMCSVPRFAIGYCRGKVSGWAKLCTCLMGNVTVLLIHNAPILVPPTLLQPNERYMSVLMEALTGDKEDLRRIALTDVQKNPSIANILPEVVLYLKQTVRRVSDIRINYTNVTGSTYLEQIVIPFCNLSGAI